MDEDGRRIALSCATTKTISTSSSANGAAVSMDTIGGTTTRPCRYRQSRTGGHGAPPVRWSCRPCPDTRSTITNSLLTAKGGCSSRIVTEVATEHSRPSSVSCSTTARSSSPMTTGGTGSWLSQKTSSRGCPASAESRRLLVAISDGAGGDIRRRGELHFCDIGCHRAGLRLTGKRRVVNVLTWTSGGQSK